MSTKSSAKLVHKADVLTVFLTGKMVGVFQSCGCSSEQLYLKEIIYLGEPNIPGDVKE